LSASTIYRRWMGLSKKSPEPLVIEYRPEVYPEVEATVFGALQEGAERIVLDLDAVAVLDTKALRGLISLLRRARSTGGEIALRSSRTDVLGTLSVTALDRVFPVLRSQAA
jgi:anti-anti-sigma factor